MLSLCLTVHDGVGTRCTVALPAVIREWGLSKAQAGFIGTAIFLGMLVGAWFWGTML